jgi:hypothetical protein
MGLNNAVITPGFIRSDSLMANGENLVQFALRSDESNNGQPVSTLERRLNMNDAFYVTDLAVMFSNAGVGGALRLQAMLQQAPVDATFGADAIAMRQVYNGGQVSLTVNDRIYLRNAPLWAMQYVDTAQNGVGPAPSFALNATDPRGRKGFLNTEDPMIRLNGPSAIDANLKLAAPFAGGATNQIYASFFALGWLVQNGGVGRAIN